ncbi:MAG: prepilin peptidase [Oscillospiraceae bacterium]
MDIIQICLDLYIFFFGLFAGMVTCMWIQKIRRGRGASLRTACTGCGRKQTLPELIPIAGFILMGGRCKKCGTAVSLCTPLSKFYSGCFICSAF